MRYLSSKALGILWAKDPAERKLGKKLTEEQEERIHEEITGQNYGYHDLVDLIEGMFK